MIPFLSFSLAKFMDKIKMRIQQYDQYPHFNFLYKIMINSLTDNSNYLIFFYFHHHYHYWNYYYLSYLLIFLQELIIIQIIINRYQIHKNQKFHIYLLKKNLLCTFSFMHLMDNYQYILKKHLLLLKMSYAFFILKIILKIQNNFDYIKCQVNLQQIKMKYFCSNLIQIL